MLLIIQGHRLQPTEAQLKTTRSDGTSHEAILRYLEGKRIGHAQYRRVPLEEIPLPCLVNYQYARDGHYGVLRHVGDREVKIMNPFNGRMDTISRQVFEDRWFSKRYGNEWALHIELAR